MKYTTPICYLLLLGMACTLHTGCSYLERLFGRKSAAAEERKKELPPLYLGTVHQVYPSQNFALLRIIGPVPQPGVTLITHPADGSTSRMGNLVVSENNTGKGGIIAADVRSGSVASGDRVFQYRSIAQPESAQTGELNDNNMVTEAQASEQAAAATQSTAQKPGAAAAPAAPPPAQAAPGEQPQVNDPPKNKPASQPAPFNVPQSPEKIPSYLNDIPNDINQWD